MNSSNINKVPLKIPADGFKGLKENFLDDLISGFTVFLLALPLSLGIAKASEFPPIMGLLTAIIGGLVVGPVMGAKMTIKGPAAGLIVIVAGAVTEFGGGTQGWQLALGVIFVAAALQVLFGIMKLGRYMDFFPLSAIHGMLAAIGIIIIAKQIPILLDINPALTRGKGPLELLGEIPYYIAHLDPRATGIGIVSLAIMLFWPKVKGPLKKLPAPLLVLLIAIPAELIMDFSHTEPDYALVKIGNLAEALEVSISFAGLAQLGIFIKYVIMFALVGSLESLLTVRAIDLMDPYKRKSDTGRDMIALGFGNMVAAVFGGLPMISEVARSSANVNNGGKTRWANIFHGIFIAFFVLFFVKYIEMIPNTALAAMLIAVGIKLAHPKEFMETFKIGKEQLLIFVVTIFFTLFEDLLIGIFAGILVKLIVHLFNGAPLKNLFRMPVRISFNDDDYLVEVYKSAIFTNFLVIRKKLEEIPTGFNVVIDLKNTKLVDHSAIENLNHFKHDYEQHGGSVQIIGLDDHKRLSKHKLSGMKKKIVTS